MARSLSIHKDGALTRSKELALSRAKAKLDGRSILKRGGRNFCTGVYVNKPRNHRHRGVTIVPIFISTGPIVTRWEDGNDRHTKTPSSHENPIVTGEPPGKGCADLWT